MKKETEINCCVLTLILLPCLLCSATAGLISNGSSVIRCVEKERKALLEFKHGFVADRCELLSSWGDHEEHSRDCCQWDGVHCSNDTGRVIELHLRGVQTDSINDRCLKGSVSASLLDLEYLKYLDLSFNDFEGGPIPSFIGSLTNLEHLNLSNANFKGEVPHQLGNLSKLTTLDLNCRSELIPHDRPVVKDLKWLSNLILLTDINLSGIDLSKVSEWYEIVNNLPRLRFLKMSECQISQAIPPSLSYVNSSTNLSVVSLSSNKFIGGSIFIWLFNLTGVNTSLVHLDLSYCLISGTIPDKLSEISSLSYLDLSLNFLVGPIPRSIWDMPNLSYLSLSWNALQGIISLPAGISNHKLTHLDLSGNSQVSPFLLKSLAQLCSLQELGLSNQKLPFEFSAIMQSLSVCSLHTLQSLDLSNNMVWGSIPDMISSFSSLRELLLYGNQLNGTISRAIGKLSKLELLDLSSNSLSTTLSHHHMSNLSSLHTLSLSENTALVVNVSIEWIPPFQLDFITLGSCILGPHFPKWLQTQTNFSWLDISNSGLSGHVPVSFWKSLPSNLQLLDLSRNSFYGTLPEVVSINFDILPRINLSTNYFSGAVPSFLANVSMLYLDNNKFSSLLPFLCPKAKTNITFLHLKNNLFSGKLPNCWMYFDQLTTLYLDNNNLSGNIPPSFSKLKSLQALHLRNNSLSGVISTSLQKCSSLVVLDLAFNSLRGYIPSRIGSSLKNLGVLILRSNRFVGGLPSSFCELSYLQILDLSNNHFSGTIPACLHNLTAMSNKTDLLPIIGIKGVYGSTDSARLMWKRQEQSFSTSLGLVKSIDFSNNKLTGQIPPGIALLTGLISLDLSRNKLNGSIFQNIGDLTALELLDLSNNRLAGKIPASLAELSTLAILDLSNNLLSGKIPVSTQIQTMGASAFAGNPGLCGDPLPKCAGDAPPVSPLNGIESARHNSSDLFPGLYISVVLGFIIGFWGVCGTLVIKTSWRHAFFRKIDKLKDKLF